ncbi:hypothetical protein AMTR_s00069p00139420 [Amborella trichopoda]|uniref:Uncharacterized protein n=1 Tax=Amborella trichopoda TaxID=13333 RepID=U5D174_AMBTC|nr:hypothetical protein AMTR_s00069p00139420 [Amborella trichopoda]
MALLFFLLQSSVVWRRDVCCPQELLARHVRSRFKAHVAACLGWLRCCEHQVLLIMVLEADGSTEMIDTHCFGGIDHNCLEVIVNGERLDVGAYAFLYSKCTKILRHLFIARHCDNLIAQTEAIRMAYDALKKGRMPNYLGKL